MPKKWLVIVVLAVFAPPACALVLADWLSASNTMVASFSRY